ncbi:MAG: hypothetical protein KZQ58_10050 [gamma proteobacterium symbiont of Bathyaustriella thionipta]|nr:hypothetical protein [gamma proteobacterium symbiont of Bathyaustriella thionipta]
MASPATSVSLLLAGLHSERDAEFIQTGAPDLWRLMRRAGSSHHSTQPPVQTLLQQAGCSWQQSPPIAALCALADGINSRQGHWLLADPMRLIADLDRVHLQGPLPQEKIQMPAEVRSLLQDEGIQGHTGNSGQHYLYYSQHTRWTATDPAQAAGANLYHNMPQGEDAGYWRRLMTEIQMQMAISQNESDEYNAWWFWGNGSLPASLKQDDLHLIGSGLLLEGIAQMRGQKLADKFDDNLESYRNTLIYIDFNYCSSLNDKKDELTKLQQDSLQPLFSAIKKGRIQTMNIQTDDACWQVRRKDSWKFWLK